MPNVLSSRCRLSIVTVPSGKGKKYYMLISQYIKALHKKYYSIRHRNRQATETKTIVGIGDILNIKDGKVKNQLPKKLIEKQAKMLRQMIRTIKPRKKT